ncbi:MULTISPECIES: hypothetical protein [Bacillus]|uniref:hypothetical protein n=1 Tax=Bacillus TaxID=1386 RepID=UPI0011A6A4A3|nr:MULTISPECIES: hypothetical protein [Bacillus]MCP1148015.1 hypothetical protein [Bacillus sp. 1735sda2]
MSKNKLHVEVPTHIIRNEKFYISNQEFHLYAYLCFLYFRNFSEEELELDHLKLKNFLKISDARTLKKRLDALYKHNLIRNKIEKLPTKGTLKIMFNGDVKKDEMFCKMNPNIFTYFKNDQIDSNGIRLAFYYKSHINEKELASRDYCFVGFETLKERLKIGSTTISNANDSLKKAKLVKIKSHKLETSYDYDEDDALVFDRWNNHYHILAPLY